jgi:hypothetical protein
MRRHASGERYAVVCSMALRPAFLPGLSAFSRQLRITGQTEIMRAPAQALACPLRVMATRPEALQPMASSLHEPPLPGDGVVLTVMAASHVTFSTRALTWTTPVVLA